MKVTLQAVVVRKNGVAVACEGINDCYTSIQIRIDRSLLTSDEINSLPMSYPINVTPSSVNILENEAKDVCGTFGCLKIAIETFEVNI